MSYSLSNKDILQNETSRNIYSQIINTSLNVEWNNIYGKPYGLDNVPELEGDVDQIKIDIANLQNAINNITGGEGTGSGIFDLGLCDSYKEGEWKFISTVKTDLDTNNRLLTQNQYKFTFYDRENNESVYRDVLYIVTNDSDTTEGLYKAPCINVYRYLWDGTLQYVINLWLVNNDGTSDIAPNLNGIYSSTLSNYQEIGSDYPFACDWKWKKVGYEQTNFYYNIETATVDQISTLENLVTERNENYSYYIRNERESLSDPFTYNLYVWDSTNSTFVLVQESVEKDVVEDITKNDEEVSTLYKDLGTYGENDDLDLIVLKDIRTNLTSNIFKGNKFEIPNVYSISKRVYNSQYSYRLPDLYVERVNYFAYVKKTVTTGNTNPWNDFTITLVKSCPEGLKKSQVIDCSDSNWDANYNFEGTVTWTELGGGGSQVESYDVTINFTDYDQELLYFSQATTLSDFNFYNLSSVTVTVGSTDYTVTTSTTTPISVPAGTVVSFSVSTPLSSQAKAFIFTKTID